MKNEKSDFHELEVIRKELQGLNERLLQVEASLENFQPQKLQPEIKETGHSEEDFEINFPFQSKSSIEFRVGEYGMAWLGNIVLLFGVIFLVEYLQNAGNSLFSALVGFLSVAGIYVSSYFMRKAYSYLSTLFSYTGHLLLYYFALRLHFFQENPLIENGTLGLLFVIVVAGALLYKAYRNESQVMTSIALLMIIASGVISNSAPTSAAIAAVVAILAVFMYYRFGWLKLAFTFIFLIYLAHLNWLLNNPLTGNSPEFILTPGAGYLYFIATGFIFSMLALVPKKEQVSDEFVIASIIWNGLGFTFILALIIISYFKEDYIPVFVSIALFCLLFAVILKLQSWLKVTASMYVLYGFMAMSVAIFGIYGLPKSYTLFALQSLLVVSMALWFRSRFMVVMNTILFLFFMIFYLKEPESSKITDFTFMLVPYISARVINWKKERLNIKTEFVRNLYLISGFIMTLIAFYHASPQSYVTASWIFAAILLFLLSLLIKNIKYRWLAIAAMGASAIRLVFVDMSSIDIGYRVLVFLGLAIISITVSILYTKHFSGKNEKG